jgi:hypothetical protein
LKRIVSISLLAGWLWALALAASPQLHQWLHGEEAGHQDHECVATLIAAGGCDAPNIAPVVVVAPLALCLVVLPECEVEVPSCFLIGAPMEHGPPVAGA